MKLTMRFNSTAKKTSSDCVLPEEWDTSFGKAMPILAEGYLAEAYLPHAEKVLRAAAFTYFAAALASVLNLGYLLLLLRR